MLCLWFYVLVLLLLSLAVFHLRMASLLYFHQDISSIVLEKHRGVKISITWLVPVIGRLEDDILLRILTRRVKWSKWPWLKIIPSICLKSIPNMSALWITPFSLTPVKRNVLLLFFSAVFLVSLTILTNAENPCSATGGGRLNLSFTINGGLFAWAEFVIRSQ